MANAQTEHSRKLRQKTAAEARRKKLASGEYRSLTVQGRASDMDIIDRAVEKAGGSRIQALKVICAAFLEAD